MSVVLDGITQYLQLMGWSAAGLKTVPITISAWVKCVDDTTQHATVAIGDASGDIFLLECGGAIAGDPIRGGAHQEGGGWVIAETSKGYTAGVWHHIAVVFAANDLRYVYIDGNSKGTDTGAQVPDSGDIDRIQIGAYGVGPSISFGGKVAEVAIWNHALSDAEIFQLSNWGVFPTDVEPSDLELWWTLENDGADSIGSDDFTEIGSPTYDAVDVPVDFRLQSYVSGDNTYQSLAATTQWISQTFTPGYSQDCTKIRLKMFRANSPGTLTVSIKAVDGSGHPTGADLASGTLGVNAITTGSSGEWYDIVFGAGAALAAGTKYAIVCRCDAADGSNTLSFRYDSSPGTYTGGNEEWSSNSGSSWTSLANNDLMFEEWGDGSVAVPVITDQSASSTVGRDSQVVLFVTATGSPTPTYQWYKDEVELVGETGATLTFYATPNGAYVYKCKVTNVQGSVWSNDITVTVITMIYRYNPFNLVLDITRTD